MHTDIHKIDSQGQISFYATYCLDPKEALRCAVIQMSKRYDTWNYHSIYVPLEEKDGAYYFRHHDEFVLFTTECKD